MTDAKRTGRVIGVMLLLQLAGLMIGFIFLDALRSTEYLASAAGDAARIRTGVIILLANCALTIGISITAWRVIRAYSQPMAMWLIIFAVFMFVMQAVDSVHIMSMLSLSQQYAEGGGHADVYNALAASVRTTRRWAHYFELAAIDVWIGMFFTILLRFAFVPRWLAAIGILTVVLHFVAIPLAAFLSYGITTNLGVPMAFGLLATAVWLMVRGFADREDG
jgi:hypothetical protein